MIWAQIEDDRITTIPPNGDIVDIYATFTFSGEPLPDGAQVHFLAGKGSPPIAARTPSELQDAITPISGIELFDSIGIVQTQFVRDDAGGLSAMSVATVSLKPVTDLLKDNVTIVAYSTFDKLGTARRLAFGSISLTVSSGEGLFASSVERYDPVADAWTTKESMPTGRSGPFCATASVSGDKMYVIGGFNGNFVDACEQYDPVLDTWATMTPMPSPRGFGSTAVVANNIYVIGGYNFSPKHASDMLHVYDPISDIWTELSPLPFPLAFSTAQVVGTDIWVFYGVMQFTEDNKPQIMNSGVIRYDTIGDAWTIEDAIFSGAASGTVLASELAGTFSITCDTLLGATGFATINRGGLTQETVRYLSNQDGTLLLAAPLAFAHSSGESLEDAALPRSRIASNSYFDGTSTIKILNGLNQSKYDGTIEQFDVSTNTSTLTSSSSNLPRIKAGSAVIGTTAYVVSGSAGKSDYVGDVETFDVSTDAVSGPSGLERMQIFRTSAGCTSASDGATTYIFVAGGQGSGHSPGWLRMEVQTSPEQIRADGRETASIVVSAVDAGGDPPTDGIKLKARGLIYISKAQKQAGTPASSKASDKSPEPLVSLMPVLFSAKDITMTSGTAATILLDRSEDFINEVENLLSFVKGNERTLNPDTLKASAKNFSNAQMVVGERRTLYSVAVEIIVDDSFYFGQTDSDATASEVEDVPMASDDFSFNPPSLKQGKSGSVGFYSDIASMPDVQRLTTDPVDLSAATAKIDLLKEEIPFGASPHFDALIAGAHARIVPDPEPPLAPPSNMTVSASDNEDSGSTSSAQDVVDEANLVSGVGRFPIFITSIVITDPVSLAARKERTDVADLELISSETGGNSFSLDDPVYVDFIIDRIKTSAPASIGSGTVTVEHEIDGAISAFGFEVDNMITGNAAILTAKYSVDGYSFVDLEFSLAAATGSGPISSTFTLASPIKTKFIQYTVKLSSKTFDSPILNSVTIQYIRPNAQYLFTYPQSVGGQVSEMAAVINHRLPDGSLATLGLSHGDSTEFDRDFVSRAQPPVLQDRGTIMSINRSFSTLLDGVLFRDKLISDDLIIYRSKSGPWAQDAVTRVFVNEAEALPTEFISVPEEGKIVFRNHLASADSVTMEVENPSRFRVGMKLENPTLSTGKLDSFAYMWGETSAKSGLRPNRPPQATNLFISPSPATPGGPLTANYTFVDTDGDEEDKDETQIIWFRNGSPVTELKNKKVITNSDLNATRADSPTGLIARGQEWFFTVRPSDGNSFGPLAVSPTVLIANQPPVGTNAKLTSSNPDDPLAFTSSDDIVVDFSYGDNDADAELGSVYTFFVNGIVAKTGTSNTLGADEEDEAGNRFIAAGNSIRADIIPSDGTDFGATISTEAVTIVGSPPTATDVSVLPTKPTAASSLLVSYKFVSVDKSKDQSRIAWFADDQRKTDFDNLTQVGRGNLKPGQKWYAIVTPFGGNVEGEPVKSNVVLVQN